MHSPALGAGISPFPSSPWKEGATPSPLHVSPSRLTSAAVVPRQCAWPCPHPRPQHWHHCLRWPAVAPSLRVPGWQPGAEGFDFGCSWGWHHSDPWREELHQTKRAIAAEFGWRRALQLWYLLKPWVKSICRTEIKISPRECCMI